MADEQKQQFALAARREELRQVALAIVDAIAGVRDFTSEEWESLTALGAEIRRLDRALDAAARAA